MLYRDGYVLCNYWKRTEQRITNSGEENNIRIVACPREEQEIKDYKKKFPARWNKP